MFCCFYASKYRIFKHRPSNTPLFLNSQCSETAFVGNVISLCFQPLLTSSKCCDFKNKFFMITWNLLSLRSWQTGVWVCWTKGRPTKIIMNDRTVFRSEMLNCLNFSSSLFWEYFLYSETSWHVFFASCYLVQLEL